MSRECISTGAVGARTRRFSEHHLLHPLILRLLVLCAPADFEAHHLLHPQIQIPNAFPDSTRFFILLYIPYFHKYFLWKLFFFEFVNSWKFHIVSALIFCLFNENLDSFLTMLKKLFKGRNYSKEETVCGSTVVSALWQDFNWIDAAETIQGRKLFAEIRYTDLEDACQKTENCWEHVNSCFFETNLIKIKCLTIF